MWEGCSLFFIKWEIQYNCTSLNERFNTTVLFSVPPRAVLIQFTYSKLCWFLSELPAACRLKTSLYCWPSCYRASLRRLRRDAAPRGIHRKSDPGLQGDRPAVRQNQTEQGDTGWELEQFFFLYFCITFRQFHSTFECLYFCCYGWFFFTKTVMCESMQFFTMSLCETCGLYSASLYPLEWLDTMLLFWNTDFILLTIMGSLRASWCQGSRTKCVPHSAVPHQKGWFDGILSHRLVFSEGFEPGSSTSGVQRYTV